jgi:hypothetical protein
MISCTPPPPPSLAQDLCHFMTEEILIDFASSLDKFGSYHLIQINPFFVLLFSINEGSPL